MRIKYQNLCQSPLFLSVSKKKARYQPTMHSQAIISSRSSKIIGNSDCSFSLNFKLRKEVEEYPCQVYIEWNHHHHVDALQSLTFKDIATYTRDKIKQMFCSGNTHSYNKFIKTIEREYSDDLHLIKNILIDLKSLPNRTE